MWDIVGTQNAMNRKWVNPNIKDTSDLLLRMLKKIDIDLKELPEDRYCEIKFEDLEKNPTKEIRSIYNRFNVQFSEEFNKQINEFLISVKGYRKNRYTIPEGDKLEINNILKSWMTEKDYGLD